LLASVSGTVDQIPNAVMRKSGPINCWFSEIHRLMIDPATMIANTPPTWIHISGMSPLVTARTAPATMSIHPAGERFDSGPALSLMSQPPTATRAIARVKSESPPNCAVNCRQGCEPDCKPPRTEALPRDRAGQQGEGNGSGDEAGDELDAAQQVDEGLDLFHRSRSVGLGRSNAAGPT
jgi:hypothetical protein